jgi:hypothetical protein
MGETVRVCINIEASIKTPKKVRTDICEIIRERFIHVGDFDKMNHDGKDFYCLSFDEPISFSYSGLSYAQELTLPAKYTKYLEEASMRIIYLEHAPEDSYSLLNYDFE